jgi:hypothetical protein
MYAGTREEAVDLMHGQASAAPPWPPRPEELSFFRPSAPNVSGDRILRIQGYSDFTRVRPAIRRAADGMAALAGTMSTSCVAFRHVGIAANRLEGLELDGGHALHCRAFARALAGCTEVVPFVLTVGEPLCRQVMALADAGDLLEAVLLETAGWLCIEDATRQFKVGLREAASRRGLRITSRMGPGYSYRIDGGTCDWPLEEQALLFALLEGAERLPVSLMPSSAMQPKLSRSGLYGIAPPGHGPAEATEFPIPSEERFQ